jgi:hypothetical protein
MEQKVFKREKLSRQSDTHGRGAYSGDRVLASMLLWIFKVLNIVVRSLHDRYTCMVDRMSRTSDIDANVGRLNAP